MHINEKWFLKGRKGDIDALAAQLNISRHLAAMLAVKLSGDGEGGTPTAEAAAEFLRPDISLMHDGLLMKDMDKALEMLAAAAASQKKILIVGDYDVDGIMGVLILCRVLDKILNSVSHCIPHRIDDGYGINDRIVTSAYENGVQLILTCDNGISAHDSINRAKSLGMEVVVTDHHDIPEKDGLDDIPAADAVVNPKRRDCGYPFKDLCGAAVAYKLAVGFAGHIGLELTGEERGELLDYAAIATICDIVGLVGENRRIVYHGLKSLNAKVRNPGLAELITACGLSGKTLTAFEIGFIIGPGINAAGRLDTAELSYDLFNETEPAKLRSITGEMLELNRARQELTAAAYENAVRLIEGGDLPVDKVIVLYMPGTHESICGIVAGKIKDKYARPAIMLTDAAPDFLKGSGRSVEGFDLLECVKNSEHLLQKFGGHKMAVGITVAKENLDMFRGELNRNCGIGDDALTPRERIDVCLEPDDVTMALINDIAQLEPFGRSNEKPVFALKGMAVEYASLIGAKRNVIKLKLRQAAPRAENRGQYGRQAIDAVFFGDTGLFLNKLNLTGDGGGSLVVRGSPRRTVDLTFHPEINDYNGIRKLQLIIRSVRNSINC